MDRVRITAPEEPEEPVQRVRIRTPEEPPEAPRKAKRGKAPPPPPPKSVARPSKAPAKPAGGFKHVPGKLTGKEIAAVQACTFWPPGTNYSFGNPKEGKDMIITLAEVRGEKVVVDPQSGNYIGQGGNAEIVISAIQDLTAWLGCATYHELYERRAELGVRILERATY